MLPSEQIKPSFDQSLSAPPSPFRGSKVRSFSCTCFYLKALWAQRLPPNLPLCTRCHPKYELGKKRDHRGQQRGGAANVGFKGVIRQMSCGKYKAPLGFHISQTLKNNIMNQKQVFIDSLLLSKSFG